MTIVKHNGALNGFNQWTLNGEAFSMEAMKPMYTVHEGRGYRLKFRNASDDIHPLLILMGLLPFWETFRKRAGAQAVMRGVNAAVVGLLGAALYNPVWTSSVKTPGDFGIALLGFCPAHRLACAAAGRSYRQRARRGRRCAVHVMTRRDGIQDSRRSVAQSYRNPANPEQSGCRTGNRGSNVGVGQTHRSSGKAGGIKVPCVADELVVQHRPDAARSRIGAHDPRDVPRRSSSGHRLRQDAADQPALVLDLQTKDAGKRLADIGIARRRLVDETCFEVRTDGRHEIHRVRPT